MRLELCLDNVERTCRDARDEATACASWGEGVTGERFNVKGVGRNDPKGGGGPITLLAVHFFRVDGIALPRHSGEHGCMCQFKKAKVSLV